MTDTRLWDRAALAIVPDAARRMPAVPHARERPPERAASCSNSCATPSCGSRRSDADRGACRHDTRRGRDPGRCHGPPPRPRQGHDQPTRRVHRRPTTRSGSRTAISSGPTRRAHKLGTQRPIRNRPRGLDDQDLPGMSKVYEPVTPLPMETLPDTFVHPAGYCQNVLATGRCAVTGHGPDGGTARRSSSNATTRGRSRSAATARTTTSRSPSTARLGVILRLVESIGGTVTRDAEVDRHRARRDPAPDSVRLRLPHRHDDALLTRRPHALPMKTPDGGPPGVVVCGRGLGQPPSSRSRSMAASSSAVPWTLGPLNQFLADRTHQPPANRITTPTATGA